MPCTLCARPTFLGEGEQCAICHIALHCYCHLCRAWLAKHKKETT